MNTEMGGFRKGLEASRELDELTFSCMKPATQSLDDPERSMKRSTKIDVLDVLPYGEAEAFIGKALRHIEANSDDLIEEYELCILVDYEPEPRPVSVEISGCREDIETGIEPVVHAADAEFWTVYKRMLNDVGDTAACAVSDHPSLAAASLDARRLAKRHDVPYTGVEMTNLDLRGYRR